MLGKLEKTKEDHEKLDKSLRLIAKTSLITFIGIFSSKLFSYIYRIIIARHFGPEVYGLFSLAAVIIGWFASIAALGLSDGLIRYIPYYRGKNEINKIRYLLRNVLIISAITSLFAGLLLFFTSGYISQQIFHNSDLTIYLQIFSILVPISVLTSPFLSVLRGYERINLYSFTNNITQNVGKVAFLLLFIWLGVKTNAVAWSYLLGVALMFAISYFVCKYYISEIFIKPKIRNNEKKELMEEVFSYSIPLMFYSIVTSIFYWIDSISIGFYKTAFEVGIYNAAVPIATLIGIAPELFMQLFFPLINKEYARGDFKLINELSKQVAKWILIINLPVFILMILFPGAALNILFGNQYLGAANALRILAIGALITSLFTISNQLLSMAGKSKTILMDIVIAAVINFVLNSILVPMHSIIGLDNSTGINGAALATLISVGVFNLMFFLQARKQLKITQFRRKMINVVFSALITAAIFVGIKAIFVINTTPVILLLLLTFFLVYILLLILTKSLDKNDMEIINIIIKKTAFLKQKKD